MAKLSNKETEQQQQQAKNRYWQNELDLLGIKPKQKKKELSEDEELENLADILSNKQCFRISDGV